MGYALVGLVLAAAMAFSFMKHPYGCAVPDTQSYIDAYHSLLNGRIHSWRMPLYPLLAGGCMDIFGPAYGGSAVALLQWLMYGVTLCYMRRLLLAVTSSQRIAFWVTAIYALMPGNFEPNQILFTETTATCLTTMMACHMAGTLRNPQVGRAAAAMLCLILLLTLKPASAPLLATSVIWLGLLVGLHRGNIRKTAVAICAGIVLAMSFLTLYLAAMHSMHGLNTLSATSTANNFFTIRQAGLITAANTSDTTLQRLIADSLPTEASTDIYRTWDEYYIIQRNVGDIRMEQFVNSTIATHKATVLRHIVNRFNSICPQYPLFSTRSEFVPWSIPFLPRPNINVAAWILAACLLVFISRLRRAPLWASEGLCISVPACLMLGTVIAGAMDDYTRLFLPVQPLFWISVAMVLNVLRIGPETEHRPTLEKQ